LKLLADSVADELLEADIMSHLKQILAASDAVVELLHNSLMLVKSLSVIGQFIALLHVRLFCILLLLMLSGL